jgi:hypothetical protein
VRKYSYGIWGTQIDNQAGRTETREADASFGIDFQNSDRLTISYHPTYERLPRPFAIARGVTVPVGAYRYDRANAAVTFGEHRRVTGTVSAEMGAFYDGTRTTLGLSSGRVEVTPRISLQPTVSLNWIDLSVGAFRTALTGSRVTYTMTPLMFVSALVQHNSSTRTLAANVRLRWEYQAGSELFVVYNDQRETVPAAPDLLGRAFIVKINRLFRF